MADESDDGGDGLSPAERETLAAELHEQAERLRLEIEAAEEADALLRADCELDAADAGTKNATKEQLRTRSAEALGLLERTLSALGRMREGTYGVCADCSRPVGRERLLAVPTAEVCVDCRHRRDAAGHRES